MDSKSKEQLKTVENKCAVKVYATKVPHVVVKTKAGYRYTLKALFKSYTYESLLTLEEGKCVSYDSKGKKKRTIQKPKSKPSQKAKPEATGGEK